MKLVVTGGTGLVGGEVLRQALARPAVSEVLSIGRRRTGLDHPKLAELVLEDFSDVGRFGERLGGVGLCLHCLAAYSFRVSRAEYEQITVGYLDALIRALEPASPKAAFCLFGAAGARSDGRSRVPALNAKGRAERRLLDARFPRKYIFRPGYIHPTRPRKRHLFYDPPMAPVFRLLPFIGIESAELARAMIETGLADPRPAAILENRDLRAFARSAA